MMTFEEKSKINASILLDLSKHGKVLKVKGKTWDHAMQEYSWETRDMDILGLKEEIVSKPLKDVMKDNHYKMISYKNRTCFMPHFVEQFHDLLEDYGLLEDKIVMLIKKNQRKVV